MCNYFLLRTRLQVAMQYVKVHHYMLIVFTILKIKGNSEEDASIFLCPTRGASFPQPV